MKKATKISNNSPQTIEKNEEGEYTHLNGSYFNLLLEPQNEKSSKSPNPLKPTLDNQNH